MTNEIKMPLVDFAERMLACTYEDYDKSDMLECKNLLQKLQNLGYSKEQISGFDHSYINTILLRVQLD